MTRYKIFIVFSLLTLLGCAHAHTISSEKGVAGEEQALYNKMHAQNVGYQYVWEGYLAKIKTNPNSGAPDLFSTKEIASANASAKLAARISVFVASIIKYSYDEALLRDVPHGRETLTKVLQEVVVQELRDTEILWTDVGQHYYALILGMKSDAFRQASKNAFNYVVKNPGGAIQKNLTPQQERTLRERIKAQENELDKSIRQILEKSIR
jgi:hypothetical protein